MTTVPKSEVGNDELVCPITYEPFRDPVVAKDGHVYEREAITEWILQKGTSPFTREPLNIEELKPDDNWTYIAKQRRNSTISYNTRHGTFKLPLLEQTPPIITQVRIERLNRVVLPYPSNKYCCKQHAKAIIAVIIICVTAGIVIHAITKESSDFPDPWKYVTKKPSISVARTKVYSQTWTFSLTKKDRSYTDADNNTFYFKAIRVSLSSKGIYIFDVNSTLQMNGYLYNSDFNSRQLSDNRLRSGDSSNGYTQSNFSHLLQYPKIYYLVIISRYPNTTGRFTVVVSSYTTATGVVLY